MTTYYVDIGSPGAWNGRTGQDTTGNQWLGVSGLQKAFDTAIAADVVYIKGTGDLSKNYTVDYDANSGNLTDGEAVTWHDGAGVVHFVGVMASPVEIELTSGNAPSDGDVITGSTSASTITAHTGVAQYTIDVNTNAGSNGSGFIKYIGVNASWTVDGTRADIDVGSAAIHGLTFTGVPDLTWFENIEVSNAGSLSNGWHWSATGCQGQVLINCAAHGCGNNGFNPVGFAVFVTFIRCVAYSNDNDGFYSTATSARFVFCVARDNGRHGFSYIASLLSGCLAHNNTNDGIYYVTYAASFLNCAIDGNGLRGISLTAHSNPITPVFLGLRVTNQSGVGDYGIDLVSEPLVLGWSYLEDNDTNLANASLLFNVPEEGGSTSSNKQDQADTDEGYVDKANHDFSTRYVDATDPTLRRTAITLPWS